MSRKSMSPSGEARSVPPTGDTENETVTPEEASGKILSEETPNQNTPNLGENGVYLKGTYRSAHGFLREDR